MSSRVVRAAPWVLILVELGVLLYGVKTLLTPEVIAESAAFRASTQTSLSTLAQTQAPLARYLLRLVRLLGAFNVGFAVLAIAIAWRGLRGLDRGAWLALVLGNTVAYGGSVVFDLLLGHLGIFEWAEMVLALLLAAALVVTSPPLALRQASRPR